MEIRICIDVDDIDKALAFYCGGLGLRVGRRLKSDWIELLGASSPIDLLREAAGSKPLGDKHPQRRDFAPHWTPVHIDFVVTDIEAATRKAVAAGATLEQPIIQRRWGRMANLRDPFGHGVDLLEMQGRGYDEMLDA